MRIPIGLALATALLTLVVAAVPAAADPPPAPATVSVTAGVHELTVDWTAVPGADRYVVRLTPTARQITTDSAAGVSFDRLVAGVEYVVSVTPIDDVDGYGEPTTATGTPADRPTSPPEVIQVSAGDDNTCALLDDGSLRCWGATADGELGTGDPATTDERAIGDDDAVVALPPIDVGARVVQVAVGGEHTCVVTEALRARCWGSDDDGALGYPGTSEIGIDDVPADAGDIDVGLDVSQIAAGADHTCALTTNGRVRCWGEGSEGQLGRASTEDVGDDETPASAGNARMGTRAVQVDVGDEHTCAITDEGAVRCWGSGDLGQLGYANTTDVGDDERPATAGDVPLGAVATSLSSGRFHNCVITATAAVRCWGDNANGQLLHQNFRRIGNDETPASAGDVPINAAISEISLGALHTCVVAPSAGLGCWGRDREGRLGYGPVGGSTPPIFVVGPVPLGDDPVDLDLGEDHSCVLTRQGTIRCFGDGFYGQLGYGDDEDVGDDETPASVDPLDLVTAPGAPVVTATGGDGSLSITYAAPGDDGGSPVTSYRVLAEPGNNSVTQTAADTLTLIGLQPGTTYTVTVTATNGYGTSGTAPVTATTAGSGPVGPAGPGYWMVDRAGDLFEFGGAAAFDGVSITAGATVVDLDATPSDNGLWVLDSAGAVHTRGDASDFGDLAAGVSGRPTTLAPTPSGDGYWIFTTTGDVSVHGSAVDHGDLTDLTLNGPIIASAATTTGEGYWLLGTDGGVFALGDARFEGSMGGIPLNRPVNGITPDPDGRGYWLVADDGGVFAFEAPFRGSVPGVLGPGVSLNAPVTGLIPYGDGYAMVATDGGAFVFSDEEFLGSLGGQTLAAPIAAMTATG
ncbi:MAG: fibronectin type III domain-containing protein [Actinomycetota bacterium]